MEVIAYKLPLLIITVILVFLVLLWYYILMINTLAEFEANKFITSEEVDSSLTAIDAGTETHTIGYEVEVLESAREDVPNIPDDEADIDTQERCEDALKPYGYHVGYDGIYELSSPAANHPHALVIATRGLVRSGWLPDGTRGMVTSHVSIGTAEPMLGVEANQERLITMLRAIEQLRGTTPNRLMSPFNYVNGRDLDTSYYAWDQKGQLGVNIDDDTSYSSWEGRNNRIEFRTFGYYDPDQFGTVLDNTYYLSRGLLSRNNTSAADIYEDYEEWLRTYFDDADLPSVPTDALDNFARIHDKDLFRWYMEPYADHLAHGNKEPLRFKTRLAVLALREEFGMTRTPCGYDDEPAVAASAA